MPRLAGDDPDAQVTEADSTAGAVKVADPTSRHDAAICARVAGRLYRLGAGPLHRGQSGAVTRFVVVSRPGQVPEHRRGQDHPVGTMHQDHPGATGEILQQFAVRGVNLCRIRSRPTKTILGSYCFAIDAEGHLDDRRLAEALLGLRRICPRRGLPRLLSAPTPNRPMCAGASTTGVREASSG